MTATGPRPPTPAQRRSADPTGSVWVTANAGTGKTRVLADRVLRLLLDGAAPEGILCLTFTKAAAAEMTSRIEQRLAAWAATADDAGLARELEDLTGAPPGPERTARARRLFAEVLELPRGLGIMTIHALCGSLLRRFPVEAGVAPHFQTIDQRTADELGREAREQVLRAGRDRATLLGQALEVLAVTLADTTLADALNEAVGQRLALVRSREAFQGSLEALLTAIYSALDVDRGLEPSALLVRACADGGHDADGLVRIANAFTRGGKRQREAAEGLLAWLNAAASDRVTIHATYESVFLTKQKGPRRDICNDKFRRDEPALVRHYDVEQARLGEVCSRVRALLVARRTEALLRVAFAAIDAYEALKARAAVLDYDDLIERTNALLERPGKGEWVRFKLDSRIDHVLVDEAQDTSPRQWEVVLKLTEEFFAGAGAREAERTLFVVGDEKQSIYSFQGADLANFRRIREQLALAARDAAKPIRSELLDRSFRSVAAVLELVDTVFALPEAQAGVVEPGTVLRHETERANAPGLVELWPLAQPPERDPPREPWPLPGSPRPRDEPERRVARAIAAAIRGWLDRGEVLESTGRPVRAGDVLILLGRRGIAQELIIRALKQAGVPAAGADRLALRDHIAVQDLIALARVMLLPEDDLSLACLLKSPLLGLGEDELFELAHGRAEASLIERLRAAAEADPARYAQAHDRLAGWLQRADFVPPFELFAWVLGADGGRRRLLARLGPDAAEPIEGFLGQALAYEQGHPASLQGFLHWLGLGSDELKRDPDLARDVVRVATVHGAKGLEAPVVFLADAGPRGPSRSRRLLWSDPELNGTGVRLPFWRAAKADRDRLTEAIVLREQEAQADEHRRLLYVALTRARDRLYVTGWLPRRERASGEDESGSTDESCWHELVARALAALPGAEPFVLDPALRLPGRGHRFRRGVAAASPHRPDGPPASLPPLPGWALTSVGDEPAGARTLMPSRGDGPAAESRPVRMRNAARFRRGLVIHRLLQLLPDLPSPGRPAAAGRLLAQLAADMPATEREALARSVLQLLARPEFAAVFAPGSRAEQPICGVVGGRAIVGQIDRLVVTPGEVLVVELKSNQAPPRDVEATPAAYLRQLAAYRALLGSLYPGRGVRAALLWTTAPRLDEVPAYLLDRHAPELA